MLPTLFQFYQPGWLRASLPCLPQTKLVGKGKLAEGMGHGFEGSRLQQRE